MSFIGKHVLVTLFFFKFWNHVLPHDAMQVRHAIMRCPSICVSVTFVHSVKTNKDIFKMFYHLVATRTILVFPYQTSWRYSNGNPPNGDVECRWGRQKLRFWANIWLHCVLWTIPAASAIHLSATNHDEFVCRMSNNNHSVAR